MPQEEALITGTLVTDLLLMEDKKFTSTVKKEYTPLHLLLKTEEEVVKWKSRSEWLLV